MPQVQVQVSNAAARGNKRVFHSFTAAAARDRVTMLEGGSLAGGYRKDDPPLFSKRWGSRDQRLSSKYQEALAPEKMAEAQHTAMGTRTRPPCPALALQNAPQKDAIHEDRARAFQKEKTSCQGRPMKAHALPCLKPLMICTLPRSPFTTTRRDALLLPRSWTTLLLAAAATPLLPLCHYRTTLHHHSVLRVR